MRCIDTVPEVDLRGKRVLVRAGFDVPLDARGEVSDLFRVKRGVMTLSYLHDLGAKIIVLSHIGRELTDTNAPVSRALSHHIPLTYIPDLLGGMAQTAISAMREGDIVMLENLRRDPREAANDDAFAQELALCGDVYVDDAFSAMHRAHTSIVGIPKFLPSYVGLLARDEIRSLSLARTPVQPSIAILGGSKFETKQPLVGELLKRYDQLFLTGALANDVYKAKGYPTGKSLISKQLPAKEVLAHPHFLAPIDVTVVGADSQARVKKPSSVGTEDMIVDIGPDSLALVAAHLEQAKFILWNGPTGIYEQGFAHYTHAIAAMVAKRVAAGAQAVIGGGDTAAAIEGSGISFETLGFVSTGGGAMLDYLLHGTLPGIEALA